MAWGAVGDEFFFPHVDSCCALVMVLANGTMVGGHVPQMWGPNQGIDTGANINKIYALMDVTRRNHAGGGDVAGIICVGPEVWTTPYGVIYGKLDAGYTLEFPALRVDTQAAPQGVDIKVKSTLDGVKVVVLDCQTKDTKTYPMPADTRIETF